MTRELLKRWVLDALRELGGSGRVIDVAKSIWAKHGTELQGTDLFYTWQYDMRWAAKRLRDEGKIKPVGRRGRPWELA